MMLTALGSKSALKKRMKKIDKELALVDSDLKVLSKSVNDPDHYVDTPDLKSLRLNHHMEEGRSPVAAKSASSEASENRLGKRDSFRPKSMPQKPKREDDRLAEYLVGSFHSVTSLKNERRLQRNKAVFMVIVVLVLMVWLWNKFL